MIKLALIILLTTCNTLTAYDFFGGKDKQKASYLISVIDSVETTPEQKMSTQYALADLYTSPNTSSYAHNFSEAIKLLEELLNNPDLNNDLKGDVKTLLANIYSGVLIEMSLFSFSNSHENYIKGIQLYKEVVQDLSIAHLKRASAHYVLGCVYAGACGTLPLPDYYRAKALFEELLVDTDLKNNSIDLYSRAQFQLADLQYKKYFEALASQKESPSAYLEQAIELYETVITHKNIGTDVKNIAQWRLADIYLTLDGHAYNYERGTQLCKDLIMNNKFDGETHILVKCALADAQALKKDATQKSVQQSIETYNEILKGVSNDALKEKLTIRLQKIVAIDQSTLMQEPVLEEVARDTQAEVQEPHVEILAPAPESTQPLVVEEPLVKKPMVEKVESQQNIANAALFMLGGLLAGYLIYNNFI